jgi:hypothetical protein
MRMIDVVHRMTSMIVFKYAVMYHVALLAGGTVVALVALLSSQSDMVNAYALTGVLAAIYMLVISVSSLLYISIWSSDDGTKTKMARIAAIVLMVSSAISAMRYFGPLVLSDSFDVDLLVAKALISSMFNWSFVVLVMVWGIAVVFMMRTSAPKSNG